MSRPVSEIVGGTASGSGTVRPHDIAWSPRQSAPRTRCVNGQVLSPLLRDQSVCRSTDGVIRDICLQSFPPFSLSSFSLYLPYHLSVCAPSSGKASPVRPHSSFMAVKESSETCCQQSMRGIATEVTECSESSDHGYILPPQRTYITDCSGVHEWFSEGKGSAHLLSLSNTKEESEGRNGRYLSGARSLSASPSRSLDESGNLANWPPNCGKNGHARANADPAFARPSRHSHEHIPPQKMLSLRECGVGLLFGVHMQSGTMHTYLLTEEIGSTSILRDAIPCLSFR